MIDSSNTWAFLALAPAAICFAGAGWLIERRKRCRQAAPKKC